MTLAEKDFIKQEIKNKISEVEENLVTLYEQSVPVPPSVAIGRLTRMDAIQQKNMAEANARSAEELIINLKSALNRIDDPDFGICMVCNQPIPIRRIIIIPETKVCVNCCSKNKF